MLDDLFRLGDSRQNVLVARFPKLVLVRAVRANLVGRAIAGCDHINLCLHGSAGYLPFDGEQFGGAGHGEDELPVLLLQLTGIPGGCSRDLAGGGSAL